MHDVECLRVRIGIFSRHLRHRGMEAAHHGALDLLLITGQGAPQSGASPEGLAILFQLLRRIALRIDADGEQADVAPLLQRDEAVLQLLHLCLQTRAGIRAGGVDEVRDPDAAEQVVPAERLSILGEERERGELAEHRQIGRDGLAEEERGDRDRQREPRERDPTRMQHEPSGLLCNDLHAARLYFKSMTQGRTLCDSGYRVSSFSRSNSRTAIAIRATSAAATPAASAK